LLKFHQTRSNAFCAFFSKLDVQWTNQTYGYVHNNALNNVGYMIFQ
jgi:hypothetical protein